MPIELRPITSDELAPFNRAENVGFGTAVPSEASLEADRSVFELDRTIAGFDRHEIVATACAYSFEMTVPGGASIPVAGVSSVTVAATHRRRGILRRMMALQLDDVANRGEPVAILNASEAAIYGRFGYGLAQLMQTWRLDTRRSSWRADPRYAHDGDLPLRLVAKGQAREAIRAIYDAWRVTRPGALTQTTAWWDCVLGDHVSWRGGGPVFVVLCDPAPAVDGSAAHDGGYAIYTVDNAHDPGHWRLGLRELTSADPRVEAALWRYVLNVDLIGTVIAEARPLDDPLRWRLNDPRQVRTTAVRDYLYVRILDVVAALGARRFAVDDELVLEVGDSFRADVAGRYRVAGGPTGAAVDRFDSASSRYADPDLELDIADLGSLYLGGVTARELAAAGRIVEHRAGAVGRADAFFRWPIQPFCVTRF